MSSYRFLQVMRCIMGLSLGLLWNSQTAAQPNQKDTQGVVGEWMLCRETIVRVKKGIRRTLADTTIVTTNVCTDVVFKADGKGLAGLDGGKKYEFLWQQRNQTITITYPLPPADPTRLHAGTYQFTLTAIQARLSNPPFVQLELSTGRGALFLLRVQ